MAMTITEIPQDGYARVVEFSDHSGFRCFIALHSTKLGPALGGCRIKPYASRDDALLDVLRLSRGMTYKSSLAGLDLGGGKCVVIADRATRDIMLKVGSAVNYFGGSYITAEDIGTTLSDIEGAAEMTPFTAHIDGSSNTAVGVLACMRAAHKYQGDWGTDLAGVPIWIQGLGKVGFDLFTRLINEDQATNLFVSDLRPDVVQQAIAMGAKEITEADKKFIAIYAPCAMGQVVNALNVDSTTYPIICGSANNQLTDDAYAQKLQDNRVLYCPDFLVNAGGVITAAGEILHWTDEQIVQHCEQLGDRMLQIFEAAKYDQMTPLGSAMVAAEARFNA